MLISEVENSLSEPLLFNNIYNVTNLYLRAIISKFTNDINDVNDYLQDIWLNIIQNIHKANDGSFKAWAVTITKNYCIDRFRRNKTKQKNKPLFTPYKVNEKYDSIVIINKVFDEMKLLPYLERNILIHRVNGKNFDEIKQILNIPKGTVLSKFRKGILKIRHSLIREQLIDDNWLDKSVRKIY